MITKTLTLVKLVPFIPVQKRVASATMTRRISYPDEVRLTLSLSNRQ